LPRNNSSREINTSNNAAVQTNRFSELLKMKKQTTD
jgi:hypothetical protein